MFDKEFMVNVFLLYDKDFCQFHKKALIFIFNVTKIIKVCYYKHITLIMSAFLVFKEVK